MSDKTFKDSAGRVYRVLDEPVEDEQFPGEPDTVRPEWEDQRIRIEALRAAVGLAQAVNSDRNECVERTINTAKQFAAWLETGGG